MMIPFNSSTKSSSSNSQYILFLNLFHATKRLVTFNTFGQNDQRKDLNKDKTILKTSSKRDPMYKSYKPCACACFVDLKSTKHVQAENVWYVMIWWELPLKAWLRCWPLDDPITEYIMQPDLPSSSAPCTVIQNALHYISLHLNMHCARFQCSEM